MDLFDEFNRDWFPGNEFWLQKIITELLVFLFKNSAGISRKIYDPSIFKDLPRVVISNFLILYLTGIVCKQNTERIKPKVNGIGGNTFWMQIILQVLNFTGKEHIKSCRGRMQDEK